MFKTTKNILSRDKKNKTSKLRSSPKADERSPSESPEGSVSSNSSCPCDNNDNNRANIFDYVQKMGAVSFRVVVTDV